MVTEARPALPPHALDKGGFALNEKRLQDRVCLGCARTWHAPAQAFGHVMLRHDRAIGRIQVRSDHGGGCHGFSSPGSITLNAMARLGPDVERCG